MKSKFIVIMASLFFVIACSNVDHQKMIFDNNKKTISLLNSKYVIDSISIKRFEEVQYSVSLKNKLKGASVLNFNHPNSEYKVFTNKLKELKCEDRDLAILIIIREKGQVVEVTENIALNAEINPFIQIRNNKYFPCSTSVDTLETEGHYK